MREWVYKATEKKIGYHETRDLAILKHFLCRSAVGEDGKKADRVSQVSIGDVIHFYYKQKTRPASSYGTFEVIDGSAYPIHFGQRVPGTALFKVLETTQNADMIRRLEAEHLRDPSRGYLRDPQFECFTGWVIKRISHAPKFDQQKMLPGPMINLWPYPDASLPKPKTPKG
jgi:hypothetical protein